MKENIRKIEWISLLKDLEIKNKEMKMPEKDYNNIKSHIHSIIGQDKETIQNRINGLNKEDEFLLLFLILGDLLQVTRLDQKKYVKNHFVIPDFVFTINNSNQLINKKPQMPQKFIVEVKKMKKGEDEFIITLEYYKKIKSYAELYELPLYFAIKMDNGYPAWFLVLANTFKDHGKIEKRKVNNRNQECYVIDGVELLNYDCLGLLFLINLVLVTSGLTIETRYDNVKLNYKNRKAINLKIKSGNEVKESSFEEENIVEGTIILKICNYLKNCNTIKNGYQETIIDSKNSILWQNEINFYILFHHLVLTLYLYLRDQCEMDTIKNNVDSIPYYLETFSDLDRGISNLIKYIIYDMFKKNILVPIK